MRQIVFIDGENVKGYVKRIATSEGKPIRFETYNLMGLLRSGIGIEADEYRYYFAKIRPHPDTPEQSARLIEENRTLHGHLSRQGFKLIRAGNVRPDYPDKRGKKPQFREKGVDVRLAVDLVSLACDNELTKAFLFASDSDYQPAVKEVQRRDKSITYVGFEGYQNKGLIFTTDASIVISTEKVLSFMQDVGGGRRNAA